MSVDEALDQVRELELIDPIVTTLAAEVERLRGIELGAEAYVTLECGGHFDKIERGTMLHLLAQHLGLVRR